MTTISFGKPSANELKRGHGKTIHTAATIGPKSYRVRRLGGWARSHGEDKGTFACGVAPGRLAFAPADGQWA